MRTDDRAAFIAALKEELVGDLLSVDEAAEVLHCERTTVLRYLRAGRIAGFQLGRQWRIPAQEMRAYVARMQEGA